MQYACYRYAEIYAPASAAAACRAPGLAPSRLNFLPRQKESPAHVRSSKKKPLGHSILFIFLCPTRTHAHPGALSANGIRGAL